MKKKLSNLFLTAVNSQRFDVALLVLRIGVAFALIKIHGIKKLLHFADTAANIPDPFGLGGTTSAIIAILANVVFAFFILLGFATRLSATFILSVTITGLLLVHINDPWSVKDVPFIYSLVMMTILILGAGRYSLDHIIHQKIKQAL